ncbi:MAG: hypothetical protein KGZ82_04225 [Bacteroidales bacterium]|nr:hypothetical protein [Bacteroidales bacterium]
MGLKAKNGNAFLKERVREIKARVDLAIFNRLTKIGEELVNYARSVPPETGFSDHTGNLRSSIGYVIVEDGSVVREDFVTVVGSEPKHVEGKTVGKNYALELSKHHTKGYALIFVAGMDYAFAVESRGRDVLTSTEYQAQIKLPQELQKLKEQIKLMKV